MTTSASFLRPLSAFSYNRFYDFIDRALWIAQKTRVIKDYFLDEQGLWNGLLIEAYAPRYDNPSSGLPWFARWKSAESWFFKLGGLTVIIEP